MKRLAILSLIYLIHSFAAHGQTEGDSKAADVEVKTPKFVKEWEGRVLKHSKTYQRTQYFAPLPSKRDRELMRPLEQDIQSFESFWRGTGSGLIRIFDISKCKSDRRVVDVSEPCPSTLIPGRAALFSFRTGSYETANIADVILNRGTLSFMGRNVLGVFTAISAQNLELASTSSPGVDLLAGLTPPVKYEELKQAYANLQQGVKYKEFIFASYLKVKEDTVFAVRSIAYDNDVYIYSRGFKFSLTDGDKRDDVIAVFKVVKMHEDGSITMIWRELQRKKAIKFVVEKPKNEK